MSKIGDYIHEWRKKNGYSQDDAAEKLFVSSASVMHWEQDTARPGYDMIRNIHDVTGAKWEDLF